MRRHELTAEAIVHAATVSTSASATLELRELPADYEVTPDIIEFVERIVVSFG